MRNRSREMGTSILRSCAISRNINEVIIQKGDEVKGGNFLFKVRDSSLCLNGTGRNLVEKEKMMIYEKEWTMLEKYL